MLSSKFRDDDAVRMYFVASKVSGAPDGIVQDLVSASAYPQAGFCTKPGVVRSMTRFERAWIV